MNMYIYIYILHHTVPYHTIPCHTDIHSTYSFTDIQVYRHTDIHAYMHTCIHSYTCIYLVADGHHPKKTIREPSHVAHVAQCCRATAENLEQLEEELKAVMEKELAACGPHQSKLKEDLGWWRDADGCTPWACTWGFMEWSGEFSNSHGANRSSLPGLREGGRTGNDMPSENESVCLWS